jgi:apolipoprotein N-acyltransferase
VKLRGIVPSRHEALVAVASSVLFGMAFPPFPFVVPVFLCLVPVAVAVARLADGDARTGAALRIGFWFGVVSSAINLYWLASALAIYTNLAFLGYAATLLGMGLIVGGALAALFAGRRATRLPLAILLPVVWVAKELFLNYLSDLAFPWLPLGLSMARVPWLAQAAELSGVHGLSFWIAAINGLLADAWLLRANRTAVVRRVAAAAALLVAVALFGVWRLSTITLRDVAPIAVVQPNVPQEEKWQEENQQRIIGMLMALARDGLSGRGAEPAGAGETVGDDGNGSSADDRPQLMLWPEAALPGFLVQHTEWADSLRTIARAYHTPIIFGVLDIVFPKSGNNQYEIFNAAMLADSLGRLGTQPAYHKAYLVPIVERVPFLDPSWFGGLRYFGAFGRGGRPTPFDLPFGKVGVLICYESIFPQRSRLYRQEGVSILVNITNDAWFGRTIAPYQHEAHLALRAIENRVGIVRAANTGISGYVDPLGRLHGATDLFVPAARTYEAQTTDIRTLYVRVGDWVGALSVLGTMGLIMMAFRRRREP